MSDVGESAIKPRILVLDHLDSFVHNLARYLMLAGAEPLVHRADQMTADECVGLNFDGLLLSPGPKGPGETPVAVELVRRPLDRPILGVCLGHQAIAAAVGATVEVGPPMHGIGDQICHDQDGVFRGCPCPLTVGRYHSLIVNQSTLPRDWTVSASNRDGVVMGIRHRIRPIEGVQFHPESVLTNHGQRMIDNFVSDCRSHRSRIVDTDTEHGVTTK